MGGTYTLTHRCRQIFTRLVTTFGCLKPQELNRVPVNQYIPPIIHHIQVFVDNSVNDPLAYTGHLDASGIAAHLAMLERVRNSLRICSFYKNPHAPREPKSSDFEAAI